MPRRVIRAAAVVLTALACVGCAGAAPSLSAHPATAPSVSTRPAIASYEDYHVEACQAWDALDRAVGNPDTGSGSRLSRALDQAVEAGDAASAERLAADIKAELASGRRHLEAAGTWAPRASTVAELDRVFEAFEAMIDAKRAAASGASDALDPQLAFEQAGGVDAWYAMFETVSASDMAAGKQCPNVPVTP